MNLIRDETRTDGNSRKFRVVEFHVKMEQVRPCGLLIERCGIEHRMPFGWDYDSNQGTITIQQPWAHQKRIDNALNRIERRFYFHSGLEVKSIHEKGARA